MKKILTLIMAIITAVSITACVPADTSGTSGATASTSGSTASTSGTTTGTKPDFKGHTFTFAIDTLAEYGYEVCGKETSSEAINAAIHERNEKMKTLYNCEIKTEYIESGVLTNDFMTGSNKIDIVCDKPVGNANYLDLATLGIDFSKAWWIKSFMDNSTADGKMRYALCYGSLAAFENTQVIIFNKRLANETVALKAINLYRLVSSGEWTLDKFFSLVKLGARDANGNGVIETDIGEVYGLALDTSNAPESFYFGAGGRYSVTSFNTEGSYSLASAIDSTSALITDTIISIYADSAVLYRDDTSLSAAIAGGKAVFAAEEIYRIGKYSEIDLGILPFPKGSEEGSYISYPTCDMLCISVPRTCADIGRIAVFLDAYAMHSKESVYPVFVKWVAEKADGESTEQILPLIFENIASDAVQRTGLANIRKDYAKNIINGTNMFEGKEEFYAEIIVKAANSYKK